MIKENLIKDTVAIITGFFIWLLFSLFLHKLIFLILNKNLRYDPIYLWSFGFFISFISAFFTAWIGKSRGWILGLILQLLITVSLILFFQTTSFTNKFLSEGICSFLNSFLKDIAIQLPWFFSASFGGFLSEKIMRK